MYQIFFESIQRISQIYETSKDGEKSVMPTFDMNMNV